MNLKGDKIKIRNNEKNKMLRNIQKTNKPEGERV